MGSKLPPGSIDILDNCLHLSQTLLDHWLQFNKLLESYPRAGPDQGKMEMAFLDLKSRIAREMSVLKARMGGQCEFDSEVIGVIAGSPNLHQIYSQSSVAVNKLRNEWHRCYIAINETVGDLEELRRKVLAGQPVLFAGKCIQLRRPVPWRKIGLYTLAAVAVVGVVSGTYVMRHFLGFWAPGAGVGYVVDATLNDEEQIQGMLITMKAAFENQDLDRVMSAFADDFRDAEGRDKTLFRALLQTYRAAFGLDRVFLGIEESVITVTDNRCTIVPIALETPEVTLTLLVEGERRGSHWLITYLDGR